MPKRLELPLTTGSGSAQSAATTHYSGGGTCQFVQTSAGVLYVFRLRSTIFEYLKSTDGGQTWATPVQIASTSFSQSITQFAAWADWWSGVAGGLIHLAYTDSNDGDVKYRSIDTASSDTLSSVTVIFAGASTAGTSNAISISRARGGNLYCAFNIDGGSEDGFARSTDVGATWAARADHSEAAADMWLLLPGHAADNQDMMMFFWDVSVNEISRKLYDDSANTWAETSISTGMVDAPQSAAFPHFAAFVDLDNSQNVLAAWNGIDTANADLKCWTVTESAITAVTDIVTNGTDDQGLCALSKDVYSGTWWAFYCGASDGSETWNGALNVYAKKSTDGGTTWSAEEKVSETFAARTRNTLWAPLLSYGQPILSGYADGALNVVVPLRAPVATFQVGG